VLLLTNRLNVNNFLQVEIQCQLCKSINNELLQIAKCVQLLVRGVWIHTEGLYQLRLPLSLPTRDVFKLNKITKETTCHTIF
jgi:hypothetical protein